MAPAEAKSIGEKYCAFLNSFHPEVKRLMRNEISVQSNQICLKESILLIYMHLYTIGKTTDDGVVVY